MSSLSQASRLADLPSAHDAFQGHAVHRLEWSSCLGPRTQRVPVYPQVFPHSSRLLHGAARPRTTTPSPPPLAALGFRWGLPCLLSTPLSIQQEASRVRQVGLKCDVLGGVFLYAPTALCGTPALVRVVQVYLTPLEAYESHICLRVLSMLSDHGEDWLADISGKVCQGPRFPEGLCTLQVIHHDIA
jgi:hypothetical protein